PPPRQAETPGKSHLPAQRRVSVGGLVAVACRYASYGISVGGIGSGDGAPTAASTLNSKYPVMIDALLLFRALPDHAGKALQRHQRLAGIGPFLQFLDRDVIERLPAGTAGEKRARNVHHVRRTRAFVK